MSEVKNLNRIFYIEKVPLLQRKRIISMDKEEQKEKYLKSKEYMKMKCISSKRKRKEKNIYGRRTLRNKKKNIILYKRGKWSEEEDNQLLKYIKMYGEGKWHIIEKYFQGRNRKQIRQRYINYLKTDLTGKRENKLIESDIDYDKESSSSDKSVFKWDDRLDEILLKEYLLNRKSWVKISKKIPGASEISVKNRFYSLLRQKVNQSKKDYKLIQKMNSISNCKDNNMNSLYVENLNNSRRKYYYIKLKEIIGNKNEIDLDIGIDTKEMLWANPYFEADYFTTKSRKKNYSIKVLLDFLPELLEDKGINIEEIIQEFRKRKNLGAHKIFTVIENHLFIYSYLHLSPSLYNDDSSIITYSTQVSDISSNLQNIQKEKLVALIENMKFKIMYNYFHQFRLKTIGI